MAKVIVTHKMYAKICYPSGIPTLNNMGDTLYATEKTRMDGQTDTSTESPFWVINNAYDLEMPQLQTTCQHKAI